MGSKGLQPFDVAKFDIQELLFDAVIGIWKFFVNFNARGCFVEVCSRIAKVYRVPFGRSCDRSRHRDWDIRLACKRSGFRPKSRMDVRLRP
ncbi:hypothetical protein N7494_004450 [Penicillium frequentans]|uniref:Uncharacterized protein n=1 Tax=Penicillium frequentans TaxID=3151616 RepID=A0AAD6D0M6_9EURO|nr:hypothetical protein N7494_004450 [Penicillium glabrum]